MKKGGGSKSTIIIGPSKSVLVYALHSLEYILGLVKSEYVVLLVFRNLIFSSDLSDFFSELLQNTCLIIIIFP